MLQESSYKARFLLNNTSPEKKNSNIKYQDTNQNQHTDFFNRYVNSWLQMLFLHCFSPHLHVKIISHELMSRYIRPAKSSLNDLFSFRCPVWLHLTRFSGSGRETTAVIVGQVEWDQLIGRLNVAHYDSRHMTSAMCPRCRVTLADSSLRLSWKHRVL